MSFHSGDRIDGIKLIDIMDISYSDSDQKTTLMIENVGEKEIIGYVHPNELQLAKSKIGGIPNGYIGAIKQEYFTYHRYAGEKKYEYRDIEKISYCKNYEKYNYIIIKLKYFEHLIIIRNKNEDIDLIKKFNDNYRGEINYNRQLSGILKKTLNIPSI
jgi:hypothetical protein